MITYNPCHSKNQTKQIVEIDFSHLSIKFIIIGDVNYTCFMDAPNRNVAEPFKYGIGAVFFISTVLYTHTNQRFSSRKCNFSHNVKNDNRHMFHYHLYWSLMQQNSRKALGI